MMFIDNITIIICAVVVVMALVTPWINVFARQPKMRDGLDDEPDESKDGEDLPKITVIITPHEQSRELDENLPLFLNQNYPAGFEVIVVTRKGDSESEDVLKRYASNSHLYATYIPDSSRYMSRKKLAITIGVKAAKNEWILMTDITSTPDSDQWLQTMARNCTEDNSLVIGYTRYNEETGDYRRFERLATDFYLMRETQKNHTYRCNSTCLMFRKSEFLKGEGFRGNLKYLRGEYDFMANKYARSMAVALENSVDAWMTEREPTDKEWRDKHLFYMEDRKHLNGASRHRFSFYADQITMHVNYMVIVAAGAFGLLTGRMIVAATAAFALLLTIILRSAIASRAFHKWFTDIPAWKTVFFEISVPWRHLCYKIRYLRADKTDFISHKI